VSVTQLEMAQAELNKTRAERAQVQAQIAALKTQAAQAARAPAGIGPAQTTAMVDVRPWYKKPLVWGIAGGGLLLIALVARRKKS
jgi:hypothetical protein